MAETVTIGCRISIGQILEIQDVKLFGEATTNSKGGLPPIQASKRIYLNGANKGEIAKLSGGTRLFGSIGYTTIPKADWEAWKAQNFNSPLLNEKEPEKALIFVAKNQNEANAMGEAVKDAPTGQEGVDLAEEHKNGLHLNKAEAAKNVQRT